ncbi:GNAT family N-acetyltransferase [Pimelobacter simplex]|nr:GNAT family N-acetyltransferase [Pimelobacter simplex]GEB13110.1 hypothetical protein NSI01_14250 [Pimelobacter simplex]
MHIRPMSPEDVTTAEQISADAFLALDLATRRPHDPEPVRRPPAGAAGWVARTEQFLVTDPGGSWVAEDDDGVVGFATSFRRERVWCLATFAVRPGRQGTGTGARLLAAAEAYGADCPHGMLAASDDPRAARRYHAAGFTLHPQMTLTGTVDRAGLPAASAVGPAVREGGADDQEWMDDLDRVRRGGPHGPDHARLRAAGRLLVTADRTGYAYANGQLLALLAAADEAAARALLVACLAGAEGRFSIDHVTAANAWAVGPALAARLDLGTSGYLGLRGLAPPTPYVHHGALL